MRRSSSGQPLHVIFHCLARIKRLTRLCENHPHQVYVLLVLETLTIALANGHSSQNPRVEFSIPRHERVQVPQPIASA